MTPTCSNAAMRVLISVLLTSTVANAAALPHQGVDTRAPAPIQNAELAAQAIQAAASVIAENPTNFFDNTSEDLNHRTAWEFLRDLWDRLFGLRDDGEEPAEVTVTVTASAEVALSTAVPTSTVEIILPSIPSTTSVPESQIFSILPIGDLTTMINVTGPTPVFSPIFSPIFSPFSESDISAATTSALAISASLPVSNGTTTDSTLPTAVSITGEFSVLIPLITAVPSPVNFTLIPFITGVPSPVNDTAPAGTGSALPVDGNATSILTNATAIASTSEPVVVVTDVPSPSNSTAPAGTGSALPVAGNATSILATAIASISTTFVVVTDVPSPSNSTAPAGTGSALPVAGNATSILANATAIANTSTTFVVVTETLIPIPILTLTGIVPSASAGLPVPIISGPLWSNSSLDLPTALPLPGTGVILSTGVASLTLETALPIGTGIPLVTDTASAIPTNMTNPFSPNTTGTASAVLTDMINPFYNTTFPAYTLPLPVLSTGVAETQNVTSFATATGSFILPLPILSTGVAAAPNVTSSATATAVFTQIPIFVTGTPGGVLINVTLSSNETLVAPLSEEASSTIEIPALTELPITVTGKPGAVVAVSVTIPSVNTTVFATPIVGTFIPVPVAAGTYV